jgi:hypothetical protein
MAEGKFEVSLSNPALAGGIYADVYEVEFPDTPTSIIRSDQNWGVKIKWYLEGTLVPFVCGYWCINLYFESMGSPKGPDHNEDEFDLRAPDHKFKLDPCLKPDKDGHVWYYYDFKVPPGTIKPGHCGRPYKVVAAVTYETICDQPGPMAGFVEGPMIQFYDPAKVPTHK